MKSPMHKQKNYNRGTSLEQSVGKLLGGDCGAGGMWVRVCVLVGVGKGIGGGSNLFYSSETSLLILIQLHISNICSVRTGVL